MKDFTLTTEIAATPAEVFAALANPIQIEAWSCFPAEMKAEEGFLFSLWDGDICGVNLKVIPDRLLVQEWYFGDVETPSIVTLQLKKAGPMTRVELTHANIPDEAYDEIAKGWDVYYLGAIKGMLEMY